MILVLLKLKINIKKINKIFCVKINNIKLIEIRIILRDIWVIEIKLISLIRRKLLKLLYKGIKVLEEPAPKGVNSINSTMFKNKDLSATSTKTIKV